jgi:hypothetical protein
MYIIKKYSASGLYSGEPVESFETAQDASDYLFDLGVKRENKGYDVDYSYKDGVLYSIEITHEEVADMITYHVKYEAPKKVFFCALCGPDDTYETEYEVDQHVSEFHIDSEDESL